MNILIVNTHFGFKGGVEKYIYKTGLLLKEQGHHLYGFFERMPENEKEFETIFEKCYIYNNHTSEQVKELFGDIDVAYIHKITNLNLLEMMQENYRTVLTVHDHDFYCMRKHKYYPYKRINCNRKFNKYYCSLCSCLMQKTGQNFPVNFLNPIKFEEFMQTLKKCDKIVVLSEYMRKNLIDNGFPDQKIHKVYPVIDNAPEPEYHKNKKLQLLYVGQLIKGKGVDQLIEIAAMLIYPFHLTIAGEGNDREYLEFLVNKFGIKKHVTFTGWVDNVDDYYNKCEAVVVPVRWQEPFGMIGPEAFSHGKPVIAFDIGGIGEWLYHEENGFLVQEGNLLAFAGFIHQLVLAPNKSKDMGQKALKIFNTKFDNEENVERIISLLQGDES